MVVQQRLIVEKARKEAEERMSPAQKATVLRKELGEAMDALANSIVKHQELCEQQRALEEKQEDVCEEAFTIKAKVDDLRMRLRDQEAQCNLQQRRTVGEQVDMAPEAKTQRELATVLSALQASSKARGVELTEEQLAPLRDARARVGAGLRPPVPPGPGACRRLGGRHAGRCRGAEGQQGQEDGRR